MNFEQNYQVNEKGIFLRRQQKGEFYWQPLTNFSAEIVKEVFFEHGEDQHRSYEISVSIEGKKFLIELAATEFEANSNWVPRYLGAGAIVHPIYMGQQHIVAAIKLNSNRVRVIRGIAHTGWAQVGGRHVFVHAKGVIGAEESPGNETGTGGQPDTGTGGQNETGTGGQSVDRPIPASGLVKAGPNGPDSERSISFDEVQPRLASYLQDFALPDVPANPRAAFKHCQNFLKLGPPRITYILFSAIWRAVLGNVRYGLHLVGPSGAFKTEVAALMQQFFGHTMDSGNLKASWSSTPNALEALAYACKDMLLVVDDFVPSGGQGDINRLHHSADRLIRGAGNQNGRARSTSDGSHRPGRFPRALIVSTGEDLPAGHSLRARLAVLEIRKGDIDSWELQYSQMYARQGNFAQATSAYITWVASRYDSITAELESARGEWRTGGQSFHRRSFEMCKELEFGFEMFIRYGMEIGAISESEAEDLNQTCADAVDELCESQQLTIQCGDPTDHFLTLLNALLGAKLAHLGCKYGNRYPQDTPEAWGYREQIIPATPKPPADDTDDSEIEFTETKSVWVPAGRLIGWVDCDTVYLIPEVAYAECESLARRNNDPLSISLRTLGKRLAERRVVLGDPDRNRIQSRITVDGVRRYVWEIPMREIYWLAKWGPTPEENDEYMGLLEA